MCPFSPERVDNINWSSVNQLREIENHVRSDAMSNCPHYHPPLDQIILLDGQFTGSTPLLRACRGESLEAVKIIIEEWGVDVNSTATYHRFSKRIEGVSPLFVAASRGNLEMVKYLLGKGADMNAQTAVSGNSKPELAGMTPLHAVAKFTMGNCSCSHCSQQEAVIKYLVDNGSDPSAVSANGLPMWKYSLLDVKATHLLISLGMSVTQKDPQYDRTMLHDWAEEIDPRTLPIIEILLEKGLNIEALDKNCLSPLDVAAIGFGGNPNVPVFEHFLRRGDISTIKRIEALELAGSTKFYFTI